MSRGNLVWTEESIVKAAKLYNKRRDFILKEPVAASRAKKAGIWNKVVAHMPFAHTRWNFELVREEARKFKTRKKFNTKSRGAYAWARERNLLDIVCAHMKPKWTLELCIADARKYGTAPEWLKNSPAAHKQAYRKGWSKECRSHFKRR